MANAASAPLKLAGPVPMVNNPGYGALDNLAVAGAVLVLVLLLVSYRCSGRVQLMQVAESARQMLSMKMVGFCNLAM